MFKYEVGKCYVDFKGNEGIKFDITDQGANLIIKFNNPSESEIENIKKGNVKVALYSENDVILFLIKFGSEQWMDAPYNINLSKHLNKLEKINFGEGLALNIYFSNSINGELKVIRTLGLPTLFSKQLFDKVEKQKEIPFTQFTYDSNINKLYRFSTKQLVDYSRVYNVTE